MALRAEIRETEKVRSDILKWKLIGIVFIVGASLAFRADALLLLIPLLCAYADALCYHLNIRIIVIGNFLSKWMHDRKPASDTQALEYLKIRKYEEFCSRVRNVFNIEDFVLDLTTIFSSLAVAGYGMSESQVGNPLFFVVSALLGIALWGWVRVVYERRKLHIAEKLKEIDMTI